VKDQEPAPPREAPRTRDDVAVHRCPFCHDTIRIDDEAWVACARCLARHHDGCFAEGARCGACGHEATLVRPAPPASRSRVGLIVVGFVGAIVLALVVLAALMVARPPVVRESVVIPRAAATALVPLEFAIDGDRRGRDGVPTGDDEVFIEEVLGSRANLGPGAEVVVRGRFALRTRADATLSLYATGGEVVEGRNHHFVARGDGRFELRTTILRDGHLHVTIYAGQNGPPIGGVYFHVTGPRR
jgi:hypothetical protein